MAGLTFGGSLAFQATATGAVAGAVGGAVYGGATSYATGDGLGRVAANTVGGAAIGAIGGAAGGYVGARLLGAGGGETAATVWRRIGANAAEGAIDGLIGGSYDGYMQTGTIAGTLEGAAIGAVFGSVVGGGLTGTAHTAGKAIAFAQTFEIHVGFNANPYGRSFSTAMSLPLELNIRRRNSVGSTAAYRDNYDAAFGGNRLPEFDGTTRGYLVTNDGRRVDLRSGPVTGARYPYSQADGHLETSAALWMNDNGVTEATVFHNNPKGTCGNCDYYVAAFLNENSILHVIPPANSVAPTPRWKATPTTYRGNSDSAY